MDLFAPHLIRWCFVGHAQFLIETRTAPEWLKAMLCRIAELADQASIIDRLIIIVVRGQINDVSTVAAVATAAATGGAAAALALLLCELRRRSHDHVKGIVRGWRRR